MIKYGVTTVDNLCSDLLNWNTLYLAGRMHKPIRIIKDDPRVRLTQQVNLTSAIRAALLTLPEKFTETELFERISGISYGGDIRMLLPAENRNKVGNIVQKQGPQFKELYYRLVTGLPGVRWENHCASIVQDTSPNARLAHLRKLPSGLLKGVASPPLNVEEAAEYWARLSARPDLASLIESGKLTYPSPTFRVYRPHRKEIKHIVRYPSTIQTVKGVVSAGVGKSGRYAVDKISKWWRAGGSGKAQPPSSPPPPRSSS